MNRISRFGYTSNLLTKANVADAAAQWALSQLAVASDSIKATIAEADARSAAIVGDRRLSNEGRAAALVKLRRETAHSVRESLESAKAEREPSAPGPSEYLGRLAEQRREVLDFRSGDPVDEMRAREIRDTLMGLDHMPMVEAIQAAIDAGDGETVGAVLGAPAVILRDALSEPEVDLLRQQWLDASGAMTEEERDVEKSLRARLDELEQIAESTRAAFLEAEREPARALHLARDEAALDAHFDPPTEGRDLSKYGTFGPEAVAAAEQATRERFGAGAEAQT